MSPRILPFSQLIAPERRRWVPFRRALSQEEHAACARILAGVTLTLPAAVPRGRPWRCAVVLMAVCSAHESRVEPIRLRLETLRVATHVPEGYPADGER